MFRFDNPDALLVLVMTLAAYTFTRAVGSGLTRWVALTGALLGLGYLTKMLQAFLVLHGLRTRVSLRPAVPRRAAMAAAGRARGAGGRGGLVGRDRPADPGRRRAVSRRFDGQQHPAAHVRLQRPRPDHRQRELRGGGGGGGGGGSEYGSQIAALVKARFTAKTVGGITVYDLTAPKTGS